jgi:hypothetical protein
MRWLCCFVDTMCGLFLACSVHAKRAEVGNGLRKEKGRSRIICAPSLPSRFSIRPFVSLPTPISSVPSLKKALSLQIPNGSQTQRHLRHSLKVATNDGGGNNFKYFDSWIWKVISTSHILMSLSHSRILPFKVLYLLTQYILCMTSYS